ncbi:major capsid protein [Zunongwangia sp.]|uniref:major capsid protein n=1 Tax=Zunongwangia sp. TaxID=1965325 RepID=UPI003AA88E41
MAVSIFKDLIDEYMEGVVLAQYEKVNGSKDAPSYDHERYLTPEYSADMTYSSVSGNYTRITADFVAYDSPLPVKSRSTIKSASGEVPKMGMKFILNEKQMNTLRILRRDPGRKMELARKVFNDSENGIFGIKELIEEAMYVGFSGGTMLIPEENNTGTAVRASYDIPKSNQFGVTGKWSDPSSKPITDLRRIKKAARAKGEYPNTIWMGADTLDNLLDNNQIKSQFAWNNNFSGDNPNIPTLDEDQIRGLLSRTLGLNLIVVERNFVHQKNGKRIVVEAWEQNMVVLTTGTNIGSLVYSTLAEEEFPVEDVQYSKANDYILVKNWGTTDPVSHATGVEAIVFPVLQNVESFFYINAEEATASEDAQTEGDAVYSYKGTKTTP